MGDYRKYPYLTTHGVNILTPLAPPSSPPGNSELNPPPLQLPPAFGIISKWHNPPCLQNSVQDIPLSIITPRCCTWKGMNIFWNPPNSVHVE